MDKYIWRVENKDGFGCYSSCMFIKMDIRHTNDKKHPSPLNDKGINRFEKYSEIFGFKDLEQANLWFSKRELNHMAKFGFELKKIKVKKITARGERQVLAIK